MNFRKIIKAICGLIFLPFALDSSTKRFITQECLHGWMVNMRISRCGIVYSVTVSFWYYAQMSQKICFELRGVPFASLPFIHSRGVWQYSSYVIQTLQFRKSSSEPSYFSSPVISKKPQLATSLISCEVILLILALDEALATKNCLLGFSIYLFSLPRDFCHFHPKLVSWSPAQMNCSGERMPFVQKSFSVGVNFELMKFFNDPIIYFPMPIIIYISVVDVYSFQDHFSLRFLVDFYLFCGVCCLLVFVRCRFLGLFVMEFKSLFTENCHADYQNIRSISDNNRDIVGSSKKNTNFLPGHKLETHSEIAQEIIDDNQLNVMQFMSPFLQLTRLLLNSEQLLRDLKYQGPMEESQEIAWIQPMPERTDGQCPLLRLYLQFLLLLRRMRLRSLINPIIDIPLQCNLNRDIPSISLLLHTRVHLEIPDIGDNNAIPIVVHLAELIYSRVVSEARCMHCDHAQAPGCVVFETAAHDGDQQVGGLDEIVPVGVLGGQHEGEGEGSQGDVYGYGEDGSFELFPHPGHAEARPDILVYAGLVQILLVVIELEDRANEARRDEHGIAQVLGIGGQDLDSKFRLVLVSEPILIVIREADVLEHLHHEYRRDVNILNPIRQVHPRQLDQDQHSKGLKKHKLSNPPPRPVPTHQVHNILLHPKQDNPFLKDNKLEHRRGRAGEQEDENWPLQAAQDVAEGDCDEEAGDQTELILWQHISVMLQYYRWVFYCPLLVITLHNGYKDIDISMKIDEEGQSFKIRHNNNNEHNKDKKQYTPEHKLILPDPQHHRFDLAFAFVQIVTDLFDFFLAVYQLCCLAAQLCAYVLAYFEVLVHQFYGLAEFLRCFCAAVVGFYHLVAD